MGTAGMEAKECGCEKNKHLSWRSIFDPCGNSWFLWVHLSQGIQSTSGTHSNVFVNNEQLCGKCSACSVISETSCWYLDPSSTCTQEHTRTLKNTNMNLCVPVFVLQVLLSDFGSGFDLLHFSVVSHLHSCLPVYSPPVSCSVCCVEFCFLLSC